MKTINSALLIVTTALVFTSCGSDKTKTSDTTNTATTTTDSLTGSTTLADTSTHDMSQMSPAPDLTGTAGPANFATTVASSGMMEVEAARLAQKNAVSKDVKDLANMLLTDHTKANAELKKIATAEKIELPKVISAEHQAHLDMLRGKTGADFDAAYLNMMDQGHSKSIALFNQASTTLTDAELKSFATKTLPILNKHADKVKSILAKM